MLLLIFRRRCGKCGFARVMWCSSQVLQESFHCIPFWHHPGLLALPSAAVKQEIIDNHRLMSFSRPAPTTTSSTHLAESSVNPTDLLRPLSEIFKDGWWSILQCAAEYRSLSIHMACWGSPLLQLGDHTDHLWSNTYIKIPEKSLSLLSILGKITTKSKQDRIRKI